MSPFVLRGSKSDSAKGVNMEISFQHAIFLHHSMKREVQYVFVVGTLRGEGGQKFRT